MSTESRQDLLVKVDPDRREFLRKIAIAAAFTAPTIATFSLDGMRKKAFAQQAYDAPQVLSLALDTGYGRAVVTFNLPMNTGVGGDLARGVSACRETWFDTSGPYPHTVTWSGNTHQVISWSGCLGGDLHVTYNQPGCGAAKFVGENGLELLPYSGQISINQPC